MASMSRDTDKTWLYNNAVTSKDGLNSTLKTAGKYLDADIKLDIDVTAGEVQANPEAGLTLEAGAGQVSVTSENVTISETEIEDGFAIVAKGKGTVSAKATGSVEVTKGGWIDAQTIDLTEKNDSLVSEEASKTIYLNKAALTTTDDASSVTATATASGFTASETETKYAVTASGAGTYSAKVTVTEGYTAGDSKTVSGDITVTDKTIYIKEGAVAAATESNEGTAKATATGFTPSETATKYKVEATAEGSFKVNVNATEGYVEAKEDAVEADYTVTKDTLYIAEAGLANSATDPDAYPTVGGPVLISESYLFIDGGIIEKQKIALKDLVPDGSNVKGKEALVYKDVSVYDNDGILVAGTMDDASVSFADSEITLSGAVSDDGATYDVTSTDAAATGTVTAGYLKADAEVKANIKATKFSIPVYDGSWE